MRTTVEIDDVYRAKLLELAARRGEKGFSRIIDEALHNYLDELARIDTTRREAIKLRGALSRDQAARLRADMMSVLGRASRVPLPRLWLN